MAQDREAYLRAEIARSKDPKRKRAFREKLQQYLSQGNQSGGEEAPGVSPIGENVADTTEILDAGAGWADKRIEDIFQPGMFKTINAATSPEMQAYLTDTRDYAQSLRNLTPLELEALDVMRNSLQGYNAPEVQAMREQGLGAIRGDTATAMRAAQGIAARNRVGGAAGAAQSLGLLRGQQQAVGNLERDLIIENARETQRRKEAFADLTGQTEERRADRGLAGQELYGGALSREESARTGRETFNATTQTNEALAREAARQAAMGLFTGTLGGQQGIDTQNNLLSFYEEQLRQNNALANKHLDFLPHKLRGVQP